MLRHVTVLMIEQMLLSSVAIPVEMLEATRARLRLQKKKDANFRIEVVAAGEGVHHGLGGMSV